jgi:hypothetical protein
METQLSRDELSYLERHNLWHQWGLTATVPWEFAYKGIKAILDQHDHDIYSACQLLEWLEAGVDTLPRIVRASLISDLQNNIRVLSYTKSGWDIHRQRRDQLYRAMLSLARGEQTRRGEGCN